MEPPLDHRRAVSKTSRSLGSFLCRIILFSDCLVTMVNKFPRDFHLQFRTYVPGLTKQVESVENFQERLLTYLCWWLTTEDYTHWRRWSSLLFLNVDLFSSTYIFWKSVKSSLVLSPIGIVFKLGKSSTYLGFWLPVIASSAEISHVSRGSWRPWTASRDRPSFRKPTSRRAAASWDRVSVKVTEKPRVHGE